MTSLRSILTSHITSLRAAIMLQLPVSFHALQALDLLAIHAPLGVLPLQLVKPTSLGIARGQIHASSIISESLAYASLFKQFRNSGIFHTWESADAWLYLSLRANEASSALEDEVTKRPATLNEARDLAEAMMTGANTEVWRSGLDGHDPAGVLGRLAICDRLARLGQVHDGIARIRGTMDAAAAEPNLDIVEAVVEELKYHSGRLEAIDGRFEAIVGEKIAELPTFTNDIASNHRTGYWGHLFKLACLSEDTTTL